MKVSIGKIIEEYNYQYYEEYKRLYQTAYCLSSQMRELTSTKDDLWTRLLRMEVLILLSIEKDRIV